MNIIGILYHTFSQIFIRMKAFMLTTLLLIISFCVLDNAVLNYYAYNYHIISAKKNIKWDTQYLYKMEYKDIHNYSEEGIIEYRNFLKNISKIDGIRNFGRYYIEASDYEIIKEHSNKEYKSIKELISLEKSLDSIHRENPVNVEVLYVDEDLLGMCGVYCEDKEIPKFYQNNGYETLIVGYNLTKQLPIGTKIFDYSSGRKFIVSHALRQNSRWLADGAFINSDTEKILDNMLVTSISEDNLAGMFNAKSYLYRNNIYFYVDKLDNVSDIVNQVIQMASIYNQYAFPVSFDDMIKEYKKSELDNSRIIYFIAFLAIVLTLVSVVLTMTVSVLLRKKEIGSMYAMGYERRDIIKCLILENIIRFSIAFIVAFLFMSYTSREYIVNGIFIHDRIFTILFFICCIFMMLSLYVPTRILKKITIIDLMKG